jgi:hypothetical protein
VSRQLARRAGARRRPVETWSAAWVEGPAKTGSSGCERLRRFEFGCGEPAKTSMPPARSALHPSARSLARSRRHSACGLDVGVLVGRSRFWVIRASEHRVDKGASGRQVPKHARLHCREVRPAEQTVPDAGSIGETTTTATPARLAALISPAAPAISLTSSGSRRCLPPRRPSRSRNSAGPGDRPSCLRSTSVQMPSPPRADQLSA